jgi:hypothetical protein
MFVRNQPSEARPFAATGRTYPGFELVTVLESAAYSNKHKCDRNITARHNIQVADVLPDTAFVAIKPLQEPIPEHGRPDILEGMYSVEIDNVRRIV